MIGILVSFWDDLFSGAMLVLGSVRVFIPERIQVSSLRIGLMV